MKSKITNNLVYCKSQVSRLTNKLPITYFLTNYLSSTSTVKVDTKQYIVGKRMQKFKHSQPKKWQEKKQKVVNLVYLKTVLWNKDSIKESSYHSLKAIDQTEIEKSY